MNSYNLAAIRAIRRYQEKYGKLPERIEATAGYRSKMSRDYFAVPESSVLIDLETYMDDALPEPAITLVKVPIVPLGTGDIVYRGVLIRNTDINLEIAQCATQEQFQRIGAKFARAGCCILGEKSSWGLQTYNPHLFFSQIEAFVFGEQDVFETMTEEQNLPGD